MGPSTSIRFCLKPETFLITENVMFSKTFSRLKIFENAGFSSTCGRTKTEVFGHDDFIYHLLLALRFHCLTFSMDGRKRLNKLRVNAHIFENAAKRSPFSKISRYVWTGPLLWSFHFDLFQVDFSNLLQRKNSLVWDTNTRQIRKREGIWAELTFTKTSGTVTKDWEKTRPFAQ